MPARPRASCALALALALAVALAAAPACTLPEGVPCMAGDRLTCPCDGGAPGFATCAPDGKGYLACDCSGARPWIPPDAAPDGNDASSAGGEGGPLVAFMQPCQNNAQCETGLCFDFPSKGPHCTRACTSATSAALCVPPSGGCNPKGVCKIP